jgi:NADP-dependent 3-hydroxy acid dehydrogenase YdfG
MVLKMSFAGKTVWVTGASSGIGEAVARGLATRGAALVLSGRREDALARLSADLGVEARVLPFEATDYDALPRVVDSALAWRGGVDVSSTTPASASAASRSTPNSMFTASSWKSTSSPRCV